MRDPVNTPITGTELIDQLMAPVAGLIQFYSAFNNGNLAQMAANWAGSDDVTIDDPAGGSARGWTEVEELYRRIFGSPTEVYLELRDYAIHATAEMFYAVGHEHGHFVQDGERVELTIRSSRIFKCVDEEWKQVHSHGSIDDSDLLARYRSALLG